MTKRTFWALPLAAAVLAAGCYSSGNGTGDGNQDVIGDPDVSDDAIADQPDATDWTDTITSPCSSDMQCAPSQWCDPCAGSSCPTCTDCVALCMPHGCATEAEPLCNMLRPECGDGEILAYQDHCFACVNPATCRPWGEPGCETDMDCSPETTCDFCGTSSCPYCRDCVAACVPHGCPTEPEALCYMIRPDCGDGGVAVVQEGCWVCVDMTSCEAIPYHDPSCDDGTEPICGMIPPLCGEWEILAYQSNCYVCVNPATCLPWGEPGCTRDANCRAEDYCDDCGTSSCPMCEDCVAACLPHGCPTEPEPACDMDRPDCGDEGVAVVQDGCWVCVNPGTCDEI